MNHERFGAALLHLSLSRALSTKCAIVTKKGVRDTSDDLERRRKEGREGGRERAFVTLAESRGDCACLRSSAGLISVPHQRSQFDDDSIRVRNDAWGWSIAPSKVLYLGF